MELEGELECSQGLPLDWPLTPLNLYCVVVGVILMLYFQYSNTALFSCHVKLNGKVVVNDELNECGWKQL
jgi:hypothetical protein